MFFAYCLPPIEAEPGFAEKVFHGLIITSILDVRILEKMVINHSNRFEYVAQGSLVKLAMTDQGVGVVEIFLINSGCSTWWDDARDLDIAAKETPAGCLCFEEDLASFVTVVGVPGRSG